MILGFIASKLFQLCSKELNERSLFWASVLSASCNRVENSSLNLLQVSEALASPELLLLSQIDAHQKLLKCT